MTVVAICSLAGAPGVSTLVAAIAGAHDSTDDPLLVVEAPPAGGVVTVRHGWPRDVTVASMAVDGEAASGMWLNARDWIGQSKIVPADPSPIVMRQAQPGRWLTDQLDTAPGPVVIDAGRIDNSVDQTDLLSGCDHVWVLLEPTPEHVAVCRTVQTYLNKLSADVGLLVRERPNCPGAHSPAEVVDTIGRQLVGTVPDDERTAWALTGKAPQKRNFRKAPLMRTAATLARRLIGQEVPA